MIKIGITEKGEPSLNYSWVKNLEKLDGIVLITKNLDNKLIEEIIKNKEKIIVHATCTGYGKTILESNIPNYKTQMENVKNLITAGFPAEKIVIRIDPLFPSVKGLVRAKEVIKLIPKDIKRIRISILDMYPHVRKRFAERNLPPPFGDDFQADGKEFERVDKFIKLIKSYGFEVEACSENKLLQVEHAGCISLKDLRLLNLENKYVPSKKTKATGEQELTDSEEIFNSSNDEMIEKRVKKSCTCIKEIKVEALDYKSDCPNNCVYCCLKHKKHSKKEKEISET